MEPAPSCTCSKIRHLSQKWDKWLKIIHDELTEDSNKNVDVLKLDFEEKRENLIDDGRPVQLVQDLWDAGEHGQHDLDVAAVLLVHGSSLGKDLGSNDLVVEVVEHDGDDADRSHLYNAYSYQFTVTKGC